MSAKSTPKSEATREKLLKAAAKIVGALGYEKASVAKIAEEAGIASGGVYYYYESRRHIFDELLPYLGRQMVAFVAIRVKHLPWGIEHEVEAFKAYLEFLALNPEFYRIFSEAQVYATEAYQKNFRATLLDFEIALNVQRQKGFLKVDPEDVQVVTYFLTGIRNYVSQLYIDGGGQTGFSIDRAARIYRKLLLEGLFKA